MKTEELAQWIRQEHDKVAELSARLREKAALCPSWHRQTWIQNVGEAFEHLRAHLTKHMALEERDGYMAAVVERQPAFSKEIERLAHEHEEIVRLMREIHDSLEQLRPDDQLLIRDCCLRIQNLLGYVEHHERDENLMVLSAYTHDIGTED